MSNVVLKNINKSYGDTHVLKGIDLTINDKEFVTFVGPSGCGKSTLLRMISGLEEPTSGTVEIDGEDVTREAPADRGIAMVFQSYALYPQMTVKQNMSFALTLEKVPQVEIDKKVAAAAELLKLDKLLDRLPKELSGGQRQRVAIGRAIVRKPKLFLFDEPLSNLDAELRVEMRVQIADLHRTLATSMVYVTHDQVEAMTLADKIVVLRDGRVEQVGPPMELYYHPCNQFVAGFIGSPKMNFIKVQVEHADAKQVTVSVAGHSLSLARNGATLTAGDWITLGIRPEHVPVIENGGEESVLEPGAWLPFRLHVAEYLGAHAFLHCQSSDIDQFTMLIDGEAAVGMKLDRDSELKAYFRSRYCHLFDNEGRALSKTD